MVDPWTLSLLVLPAGWWLMHRSYRRIWQHRLQWWAIPFAHGAVLFGKRLERWEAVTTTGVEPTEREWFSICSAHQQYDPTCETCHHGAWSDSDGSFMQRLMRRD